MRYPPLGSIGVALAQVSGSSWPPVEGPDHGVDAATHVGMASYVAAQNVDCTWTSIPNTLFTPPTNRRSPSFCHQPACPNSSGNPRIPKLHGVDTRPRRQDEAIKYRRVRCPSRELIDQDRHRVDHR